jgi:hypothetical protein
MTVFKLDPRAPLRTYEEAIGVPMQLPEPTPQDLLNKRIHKLARKHCRYYKATGRYVFTLDQVISFATAIAKEAME